MKTIKFRAWEPTTKQMVWGFYVRSDGDIFWEDEDDELGQERNLIVMQFTGLLDKNGREIYEGDILRRPGFQSVWKVEWDEEYACFGKSSGGTRQSRIDGGEEVIGNVHENPELLK